MGVNLAHYNHPGNFSSHRPALQTNDIRTSFGETRRERFLKLLKRSQRGFQAENCCFEPLSAQPHIDFLILFVCSWFSDLRTIICILIKLLFQSFQLLLPAFITSSNPLSFVLMWKFDKHAISVFHFLTNVSSYYVQKSHYVTSGGPFVGGASPPSSR